MHKHAFCAKIKFSDTEAAGAGRADTHMLVEDVEPAATSGTNVTWARNKNKTIKI